MENVRRGGRYTKTPGGTFWSNSKGLRGGRSNSTPFSNFALPHSSMARGENMTRGNPRWRKPGVACGRVVKKTNTTTYNTRLRSSSAVLKPSRGAANSVVKQFSNDPLNLQWVMEESQRREQAGLSPLPGDSALNSPEMNQSQYSPEIVTSPQEEDSSREGTSSATAAATSESGATAVKRSSSDNLPSQSNHTWNQAAKRQRKNSNSTSRNNSTTKFFKSPFQGNKFLPIYGNYRTYYGKRLHAGALDIGRMQDDRLHLLLPDWYQGKDVLDIGCNDGIFTLKIAEQLDVHSMTGVDIDGHLIQLAQRNLQKKVTEFEEEKSLKAGLAEEGYAASSPAAESDKESTKDKGFPYNVYFQTGNYVVDSDDDLMKVEENKYDIIQAFSITKWIHLNWGDKGLILFFKRAFKELKPDGKLIIEPQPYSSYKKKLLISTHKQNYASNIQIKPEQFQNILESEVGFAHILSISEQLQHHGFQRPVLMASKPTGQTPALLHRDSSHNFRHYVPPVSSRGGRQTRNSQFNDSNDTQPLFPTAASSEHLLMMDYIAAVSSTVETPTSDEGLASSPPLTSDDPLVVADHVDDFSTNYPEDSNPSSPVAVVKTDSTPSVKIEPT